MRRDRNRKTDGEFAEILAPGALRLPDGDIPVSLNWGPLIGHARLALDGGGIIAEIKLDGPEGPAAADRILREPFTGLSFEFGTNRHGEPEGRAVPVETAPRPAIDAGPLPPPRSTWEPWGEGTRHRHFDVEHDHLAGDRPHRHDDQTGAQIPVGCDPVTCRYPFGSHARTCRL